MTPQAQGETIVTGTVQSVNDRGIKLEGRDDWLNFSKYHTFSVLPARGDTVALTIDRGGRFVNGLRVLSGGDLEAMEGELPAGGDFPPPEPDDDDPATWSPRPAVPAPQGAQTSRPAAPVRPQRLAQPPAARSRESIRATCALAAATFAAGRPDVEFADVLGMAQTLYDFCTKEEG